MKGKVTVANCGTPLTRTAEGEKVETKHCVCREKKFYRLWSWWIGSSDQVHGENDMPAQHIFWTPHAEVKQTANVVVVVSLHVHTDKHFSLQDY